MAIVIVIVNDDDEYDNLTGYMSINKQYLNVLCIRKSGRMGGGIGTNGSRVGFCVNGQISFHSYFSDIVLYQD